MEHNWKRGDCKLVFHLLSVKGLQKFTKKDHLENVVCLFVAALLLLLFSLSGKEMCIYWLTKMDNIDLYYCVVVEWFKYMTGHVLSGVQYALKQGI